MSVCLDTKVDVSWMDLFAMAESLIQWRINITQSVVVRHASALYQLELVESDWWNLLGSWVATHTKILAVGRLLDYCCVLAAQPIHTTGLCVILDSGFCVLKKGLS